MHFMPAPFRAPIRAFAGLVFAWRGEEVLVCDIYGRGWCIPSGRVEPYETSFEAVKREALEEGGAILEGIQYLGSYQISERNEVRWADAYVAHVSDLVEIQVVEESRDRQFMRLEDLSSCYHNWNELTEKVFQFSYEVYTRSRA